MKINTELLNEVLDKTQERLILNKNFELSKLLDEDLLKAYTRLIEDYDNMANLKDDADDLIIELVNEMVDRGIVVPVI